MAEVKKREYWIDNVKVVACLLVVLRHFFQSMTRANVLPITGVYIWFDIIPWYCAVQIFFFCSGYLYQKRSKIETLKDWFYAIINKLIAFGIPYFVFSTLTWILKKVFESSVNVPVGSLHEVLFIEPVPPYWYLYIAFFMFAITITMSNTSKMIAIVVMAIVLKISTFFFGWFGIYAINMTFAQEIWFVIGMVLAFFVPKGKTVEIKKKGLGLVIGVALLAAFMGLSWYGCTKAMEASNHPWVLLMEIMSSTALTLIAISLSRTDGQPKIFAFLAKYLMPIFLMHTLAAASFRALLFKLGVTNSAIHVIFGLIVSVCVPILAAFIMSKVKVLDAIIYPTKYIKIKPKQKEAK